MLEPKYKITGKIANNLLKIIDAKKVVDSAKILPKLALNLRRQAIIRMTHHSTEIEGNRLNMNQVADLYANKKVDAPEREIYEVKNYLSALKFIEKTVKAKKNITEKIILNIHKLVTAKTMNIKDCGHYRQGPIYVVRRRLGQANEVIYTGPAAKKVPGLMSDLIKWVTQAIKEDLNPVIIAGIAHQEIAAIHPFNDGNGRTARALATLILYSLGYDFRRLFALEDYYNTDRQSYYDAINIGKTYEKRDMDFTKWLEYFIEGFWAEIALVKSKVEELSTKKLNAKIAEKIYLEKDEEKVLDFLEYMGKITINDAVDILSIPKRTAQYKLKNMKKRKLIKQVGKGPKSAYVNV